MSHRTKSMTLYRIVPVEVELRYHYYPPCKGSRGSYGVPMEPDEDAEVEDIEVIDPATGKEFPRRSGEFQAVMALDEFCDEEGAPIDKEKIVEELLEEECESRRWEP